MAGWGMNGVREMLMRGNSQPNSALFENFDRLLLLQRGGECVYFGDIGRDANVCSPPLVNSFSLPFHLRLMNMAKTKGSPLLLPQKRRPLSSRRQSRRMDARCCRRRHGPPHRRPRLGRHMARILRTSQR